MRSLRPEFLYRWSIRQTLYALVLCAVCPALLVIIFYGAQDYYRAQLQTRDQTLNLVKSIAFQQQILTENTRILLHTLARLPEVISANPPAMHELFKGLLTVHSNYSNISFVDMNGYLVSSSHVFKPPIIAYDRKYFKDAVRTKQFSAGEFVVGRVVQDPIFQFSTPVFNEAGDMSGVLVATMKLNMYDHLYSETVLPDHWRFALIDHQGIRLHRFPKNDAIAPGKPILPEIRTVFENSAMDEGNVQAIGPDGVRLEYAFVKLRLSPQEPPYMTVAVGLPVVAFTQVFVAKLLPALTLMLGVLALALLTARFLGKMTIGAGLDRLALAARQLSAGDLSFRVGPLDSCREVREAGQAFDQMATALSEESAERRQAEQGLTRAKSYIANILDSMPSVLVGVDQDGVVTHWNKAAEEAEGISSAQAQGQPLEAVFPRLGSHLKDIRTALRERRPQHVEREMFHKGNTVGYQDVMVYPLISNGVEGVVVRVDDVTHRVHLEEMMVQSEKMVSVGGLAAGMAHEINNPLSGILQSAQVLISHLSPDVPANRAAAEASGCTMENIRAYAEKRQLPDFLEGIRESGVRAARIVSNMLEFSRKSHSTRTPEQVNDLMDKAVELALSDYDLKKQYDFKRVRIVREYDPHLPEAPCTRTEIEQVFLNLLKNAAHAMAQAPDNAPPPAIVLRTAVDGDWLRIEVEDNGPGMPESVRKRVFEPFFTTKPVGEGTGLGLSVSYFIIVTNHGGRFEVQSEPGKGARFILWLPLGN
ncbi:ATP-binding protein [Fundidesulfovibrio putealis]|uniref:ATP-binding protein n=1 Tax=Fundidesulfovibrio putealis TaxID=270496 RepID=UPI0004057AFD|nr:ATP-binding protein [Fundidesulfovibrio putealis]